MRKFVVLLLCIFTLTGCGSTVAPSESASTSTSAESSTTTDSSENSDDSIIYESESGFSKSVQVIPYDNLAYNDKTFTLKSVDFYRMQSKSGFGYFPFVVIQFDLSNLSDSDIYWMMQETDTLGLRTFGVDVYLTSDQNVIDSKNMKRLYATYDTESAVYIYYLPKEYKYDFSDLELSISISIEQDETYDYKDSKSKKSNSYLLFINDEYSELQLSAQDFSAIPADIMAYIQTGLNQ